VVAADRAAGDEVSLRLGLVFDTRDREASPQNGVLLEALHSRADADVAGDLTYSRTTVSARGWLAFNEKWGVAARVAGETMGGTPAVGSYFTIEGSERRVEALGGPESHRGLYRFRFLDADKLLGNFEVRYAIYPYFVRPVLVAFVDVGRVFPAGELELTTDDLKVGGGLGLYIQLLSENALLGGTVGYGPDGIAVQGAWRWAF
jgi:outer membrane protein assembly factor BamA